MPVLLSDEAPLAMTPGGTPQSRPPPSRRMERTMLREGQGRKGEGLGDGCGGEAPRGRRRGWESSRGLAGGEGAAATQSEAIHEALEGQPEKPHVFNGGDAGNGLSRGGEGTPPGGSAGGQGTGKGEKAQPSRPQRARHSRLPLRF